MKSFKNLLRPVVTLSKSQFHDACTSLWERIVELGSTDLIVVVPRAGVYILNEFQASAAWQGVGVVQIKAQRMLTKHKSNSFVGCLLKSLPQSINNLLRQLESAASELMYILRGARASRLLSYDESLIGSVINAKQIVIVDDAIDSGESIKSIVHFIRQKNATAKIYVAVLATTFNKPAVTPDVSLYVGKIIRFPWAEDYVEQKN